MSTSTNATIRLDTCPGCGGRELVRLYDIPWERIVPVWMCSQCGLVFQRTPLTGEELDHYYRANSTFHFHGPGSRQERLMQARHAFLGNVLNELQVSRPRVLDVGCGFGDFLASFDQGRWDRVGIELNSERAAYARNRFRLQISEKTLETSGIKPHSVDLLCGFGLIEHFHAIREFLAAVHLALAPGGLGCFSVADLANPDHGVSDYFSVEHILYFTQHTLESLVVAAGFTPLHTGPLTPPDYKDIACLFRKELEEFDWRGMRPVPAEVQRIRETIEVYAQQRFDFIRRLRDRLSAAGLFDDGLQIGIYGAGGHTEQLLDGIPELRAVTIFFDSDPQKHGRPFLCGTVYDPAAIARLGLDAVIISTRAFEEEIMAAISPITPPGMRMVPLYGHFEEIQ